MSISVQLGQTLRLLFVLFIAACSSPVIKDGAPRRAPGNLERLPDPVVRTLPRSKSGNRSPYTVLGKQYTLLPRAEGYRAVGNASWYGSKFHGRLTSSGEPYNMYKLTAAHKSLPIPCFVRVSNLDNGRSTIVRVNDRGPFHSKRIIDLSYAAAVKLGFANKGTARVRVEVVTPKTHLAQNKVGRSSVEKTHVSRAIPTIYLQAGAFGERHAASVFLTKLKNLVGPIVHIAGSSDGLFRVNIGPVSHLREAERIQALMVSANFSRPLILRR